MCELGWKSISVLELTALPSIGPERWLPWVRQADVLLANGGDVLYLCHRMRQSGVADLLPSLHRKRRSASRSRPLRRCPDIPEASAVIAYAG